MTHPTLIYYKWPDEVNFKKQDWFFTSPVALHAGKFRKRRFGWLLPHPLETGALS
jgi:hypothetical protein